MSINGAFKLTTCGWALMALIFLPALILAPVAVAADGEVLSHQKISDTVGGFSGVVPDYGYFGSSVTSLGHLDGDGVVDLAVGVPRDTDGGGTPGAVWVLLLNDDGTVKAQQKISATAGGFAGELESMDAFGCTVASLGDLDGDQVVDLAVGAYGDDDGGSGFGAVWILFLNRDGTVKAHQKISGTAGGFTGELEDNDYFGISVTSLGDLDGDGIPDLAAGAYMDDDGGSARGAVWILFLNSDGTVKGHQKISDTAGGFTGTLLDTDWFGLALAAIGDLDGDGVADLCVGPGGDDTGGPYRGAVWILFLNGDGTVKGHQKISDFDGGFTGTLDDYSYFGWSVTSPGDLDLDGVADLAVGAKNDDDGGSDRGAVWILFLNSDGTVREHQKISDTAGGFTGTLDSNDDFGRAVASLGDLDDDGRPDLAVGASNDDDGGTNRGAVWILFLDAIPRGVSADLTCVPASGTLPFSTQMTVVLTNHYTGQTRRAAARIDVTLANGQSFSNWMAGYANIAAGGTYSSSWSTTILQTGSMIGDNQFLLLAEDVTPAPYNQPPEPPAGETGRASCVATGFAP